MGKVCLIIGIIILISMVCIEFYNLYKKKKKNLFNKKQEAYVLNKYPPGTGHISYQTLTEWKKDRETIGTFHRVIKHYEVPYPFERFSTIVRGAPPRIEYRPLAMVEIEWW
jgi:hypothetical protein